MKGGHMVKPPMIVYTKEATEYRQTFVSDVGKRYFMDLQRFVRGHTIYSVYEVTLVYVFETLVNKGWLDVTRDGKRGAKSPYKTVDTGNRRKLLEDCIVNVLGNVIDDKLSFSLYEVKRMEPGNSRVEIFLSEGDPHDFGVPDQYTRD